MKPECNALGAAVMTAALFITTAVATLAESEPIPLDQVGAIATKQVEGDSLSITVTHNGARLRCAFQRLEGEATSEGLWLTSTTEAAQGERFRVVAVSVGRAESEQSALTATGKVLVSDQLVRLIRPGLTEEYSVSVDGVRQDFIIESPPPTPRPLPLAPSPGDLRLELAVTGAHVEPSAMGSGTATGAQLALEGSGRRIAYSRLRVTDAKGKELSARMEVAGKSEMGLAILVDDTNAIYPVRIDPTFSDANWISMNPSIPGADGYVYAAVVDGSGNLYIGSGFTFVGDVFANRIAKWNGGSWSALGSGIQGGSYCWVLALAVSGSNLYAGGQFTTAGGVSAPNIAKWDGSSWSALGEGMNNRVRALAVLGSDLYAGGSFTNAGGVSANHIAKWDGSSWSPLGEGIGGDVHALAVSGNDLYAGGTFTTAGGVPAKYIAKWDGSSWNPLGSGMQGGAFPYVLALAASGSGLYAGGPFATAGGVSANQIAKWNGSSWSALGSGMQGGSYPSYPYVSALAVSGGDLYAGGRFTTAGGVAANDIAKWDGSSWTALGSGIGLQCLCACGVGQRLVCGRFFHECGREGISLHRAGGAG